MSVACVSGLFFFLCADLQNFSRLQIVVNSVSNKINGLGAGFIDVRRFGFEMLFARVCHLPSWL